MESTINATIALIVDRKPSTAIFEKNAKIISKSILQSYDSKVRFEGCFEIRN